MMRLVELSDRNVKIIDMLGITDPLCVNAECLQLDGSRTVLISYGHLSGRAAVFEPGGDLQEDDI